MSETDRELLTEHFGQIGNYSYGQDVAGKKETSVAAQTTLVLPCIFPGSAAARTFREPALPLPDPRLSVDDGPASRKSCFDRSRNVKSVRSDAVRGIPLKVKWNVINGARKPTHLIRNAALIVHETITRVSTNTCTYSPPSMISIAREPELLADPIPRADHSGSL